MCAAEALGEPVFPLALELVTVDEIPAPGLPGPMDDIQRGMVIEHMGLAHSRAARYFNKRMEAEDVTQNAMLGLINAVRRFDPSRGVDFSTFATPTIDGEIKRGFRGDRPIRSRTYSETYQRINGTKEALYAKLQREPTTEEVIAEAGVTLHVMRLYHEIGLVASLDAPVRTGDGEAALSDTLPSSNQTEDTAISSILQKQVVSAMDRVLKPAETATLRERFLYEGDEQPTQEAVAAIVGYSQMHVSRLERSSLAKLRDFIDDEPVYEEA